MAPLLSCRLSKNFGPKAALRDIAFEIFPGETVGYVGPNGAGKSTTLRILTGLEQDFEGHVNFDGAHSQSLGYMPQSVSFAPWRTAEETLFFFGRLSGMDEASLGERVPLMLEWVGLSVDAKNRVGTFSGGMRQRLGLAQALLHDPAFLVLDEPFNHLDPEGRQHLKRLLMDVNQRGTTILFSSHLLSDVEELVQRMLVLQRGQLVFDGKPQDLKKLHPDHRAIEIGLEPASGAAAQLDTLALDSLPGVETLLILPKGVHVRVAPEFPLEAVTTHVIQKAIEGGHFVGHVKSLAPSLEAMIAEMA